MNHLGERITTLVDGQLGVPAAERAVLHLAECDECRTAVELERLTKHRLCTLNAPRPGEDFVARLLEMAGPSGPLPPRPGHVPGSPRPQFVSTAGLRPPSRRGSSRPADRRTGGTATVTRMAGIGRSSRTRVAAAMVGAVCLVGAGVAGGVAHGGVVDQGRLSSPAGETFLVAHGTAKPGSAQPGSAQSGSVSGSVSTSLLPMNDQTVLWGPVSSAGR